MSEYTLCPISPSDRRACQAMDALLVQEGISRDQNLTYSVGLFDEEGALAATGSLYANTLRCLAVSREHQGEGLMAQIVAHLTEVQLARGNTHLFLYTKCESAKYFAPLGFYEIARVDGRLVFMENRRRGFARYLDGLRAQLENAQTPAAALVMNANPFTNGHAALLRRAALENERVVLFVLSEDCSLVPYEDRLAMVRAAAAAYDNVTVVPSGSYMISSATFPSYFLKDNALVTRVHAALDATLFTRIAQALHIVCRYVGEEPFSPTTRAYNEALARILPGAGVELRVIRRTEHDGEAISASHVRQLIHDGPLETIRPLVPETTYAYLCGPGQRAVARIRACADVIHH